MDIRVLQYFLTVAREGSITAAAETLNMTQPPLSRQLKDLEEELDKTLFLRGNRKIILTEEGMLLRKRAEEMVELMEKTKAELTSSQEQTSGEIFIGAAETDAIRFLAKIIKKIQQEYPSINFHFYSGNAQDISEKLESGLFDFGVFIEPTNMQNYNYIQLPVKDRWGLLMRKDDKLSSKKYITPEDLEHLPIIFTNQEMAKNEFNGWGNDIFSKLRIVATYNLPFNASILVEEHVGYALCLDKIIRITNDSIFCFCPLRPKLEVNVNIGWKKHQIFSKAATVFLEKLREELKPMF